MKQLQLIEQVALIEQAFIDYYEGLLRYAWTLTKNGDTAKDIVQRVFLSFLEKKDRIAITESVRSYLFSAVYYQGINHNSRKKNFVPVEELSDHIQTGASNEKIELDEVKKKIHQAIGKLPDQCRKIFLMNREEYKTYSEIATELQIAVKTVEAQMSKALKILRAELSDLLFLILIIRTFL